MRRPVHASARARTAMVHLDRVQRRFGPQLLFEALSWRIAPGARIGLVGPNGAGKTTLLRLAAGRELPDAGTVHRSRGLVVGFLPQEVETVEGGTVLEAALAGSEELVRLEHELRTTAAGLADAPPASAEHRQLERRYAELRQRFEALDGDRIEARARSSAGWASPRPGSRHR
jgi:ATP-binding cassette subfamily F protein 3